MPDIDLTCSELVELVTDYLEDALTPAERERFLAHVDECGDCATFLDQMKRTIGLVERLGSEPVAPEVCDALLAHFRDWKRAKTL